MLYSSVLLHANALYAEIPFSDIPLVVENSYLKVLEMILRNPAFKITMNFSGYTLELINGEHPDIYEGCPELVNRLKEAIGMKQVEITGTSWAHIVLPMLPADLIKKDIEMFNKTVKRVLDYTPEGFFPPELGISPLMPMILDECGYKWSFYDREFVRLTEGGHMNACNDVEPVPLSFGKEIAGAKFRNIFHQLMYLIKMQRDIKKWLFK